MSEGRMYDAENDDTIDLRFYGDQVIDENALNEDELLDAIDIRKEGR